jgi:signal transduction histidine kinase
MARAQHHLVNTLEEQVARRSAELADFAARNARLEERNRLSGDLHDTVTQTLFSAAVLSDALADQWQQDPAMSVAKLRQLAQMNRHALAEMRLMLAELRTEGAVEKPLSQLISTLASEFADSIGQAVRIECEISGDTLLPLDVQAMMYRIAQESLNNVVRHAQASRVSIALEALPGQAMLSISDNGRGFDPGQVPDGHLGLQIMRERARRIDAVLEVESRPGQGTTITAIWMQRA